MRVIAGSLGGRVFNAPKGRKTHPMSEKSRGSMFASLGDISGLSILDAYSGSGALALEAISRGANEAVCIDNDKDSVRIINENIKRLAIGNSVKVTNANISSWLENNVEKKFDLVFADPPFDKVRYDVLQKLGDHVKKDGIIALSLPSNFKPKKLNKLKKVSENKFADNKIEFYRKIG